MWQYEVMLAVRPFGPVKANVSDGWNIYFIDLWGGNYCQCQQIFIPIINRDIVLLEFHSYICNTQRNCGLK